MLDAREGNPVTASGTAITVTSQDDAVELTPTADTTYTVDASKVYSGARLAVTNKAEGFKATVQGVEVPAGKTVSLYFDGKTWFSGEIVEVTISGKTDTVKAAAETVNDEETE